MINGQEGKAITSFQRRFCIGILSHDANRQGTGSSI
jgi:hypothetical protein